MQYRNELSKRLLSFAVTVIKYSRKLPKQSGYHIIRYQSIKRVTSAGANYRESQSASSMADFRRKVFISLKEISESPFGGKSIHHF
jgi:four helix bundle protein